MRRRQGIRLQAGKLVYSPSEAARALGIDTDRLRVLALRQFSSRHPGSSAPPTRFAPSQLLMLAVTAAGNER
jgi:hypothetical protein